MKDWILPMTALLAVASLADAAEPWSSPPPNSGGLRESPPRAKIFPTAYGWVNSMRQEAAAPVPPPLARPAVVGSANIGQASDDRGGDHGAMIAATAWNHEHQYTGYVYSPGACDHTPPCVDHLWDGYCQRPCRCGAHGHHFHRCCGVATNGCSSCGGNSGCGCGGGHGMLFGGCHGCRLHGMKHFGGCGCSTCAPACNTCGGGCGHGLGLGHFHNKCRSWFNNLCSACDGGMSCGCSDGMNGMMNGAPAGNSPEVVPTPATDLPTPPAADDAKSARKTFNRYVPWSLK